MLKYIVRRILLAVPTLLVISWFTFGLSKCSPPPSGLEDSDRPGFGGSSAQVKQAIARDYAHKFGLDKPEFYFSVTAAAFPDSLYRIYPINDRERMIQLTAQTGNWNAVSGFHATFRQMSDQVKTLPESNHLKTRLAYALDVLGRTTHFDTLGPLFDRMTLAAEASPSFGPRIAQLRAQAQSLATDRKPTLLWTPTVYWYGFDNQYHHWLMGFLTGNLGQTIDQKDVWAELRPALWSTLSVNGLALLLAYLVSIPLGVFLARRPNSWIDRWTKPVLMFLNAMPSFWIAALFIIAFVSHDALIPLVERFTIIPLQGSGWYAPVWLMENMPVILLPIIVLSIHATAILTLQMRGGILNVINQDFIRTARAKGLSETQVYWDHAYSNALFPIIAVFSSLFPSIFVGSIVVESVFNFGGIGSKTLVAIDSYDYAMLYTIVMLSAAVTLIGYLLADLLYAWVDPRVRFDQK